MNRTHGPLSASAGLRLPAAMLLALLALAPLCAAPASAQVPGRFYWKTLSNANAVPLIVNSITGNTNPFDPSHTLTGSGNVNATLIMGGYARTMTLFERSAMLAYIQPMGRLSGEVTSGLTTVNESARGFGDPMLEFDINVLGPPAQKNIPDLLRYQPGFSVDVLADLAVPIGEYDNSSPLNLGQNRWYGRLGAPTVWQLGAWVPGRRTTLELLPAVWFFGPNDDFVGQKLETDPLFQVDVHLTRDFTEHFWGAFDASWYNGAKASVNGVEGTELDNLGLGFTFGYPVNENLNLTFGYKSTINDSAPDDLRMDGVMVTLVYGWHPLIEGSRRLKESE